MHAEYQHDTEHWKCHSFRKRLFLIFVMDHNPCEETAWVEAGWEPGQDTDLRAEIQPDLDAFEPFPGHEDPMDNLYRPRSPKSSVAYQRHFHSFKGGHCQMLNHDPV